MQPPISLQNLTDDEKARVAAAAQKSLVRGIVIYLIPFAIFGFLVWYVNQHYMGLGLEDANVRSFLNVLLVFLAILPARLFVNVVLRWRKAQNAWQKKVIRGKVTGKKGRTVFVAGQKIRLDEQQAAKINVEDNVEIGISATSDFVLYVEIVQENKLQETK